MFERQRIREVESDAATRFAPCKLHKISANGSFEEISDDFSSPTSLTVNKKNFAIPDEHNVTLYAYLLKIYPQSVLVLSLVSSVAA